MDARLIDQRGVIHARWTSGAATETGQTTVEMKHSFRIGCSTAFEHLLHQHDASARTITFVTQQHVSRAGRRAKAAVHTGAQRLLGIAHMRIGELFSAKVGAHQMYSYILPGLNMRCGSK